MSSANLPVAKAKDKSKDVPAKASRSKGQLVPLGKKQYVPSVEVKKRSDGTVVTSESFGIEAVINGRQGMMSSIIAAGSKVPVSHTRRYFPIEDYQGLVQVVAFKGEHRNARDNIKIGEFLVSGLLKRKKDDSLGIDIKFTINREGVILVDAVEVENPDNHLKVKLEYSTDGLIKGVAKGFVREMVGLFLPSGKK